MKKILSAITAAALVLPLPAAVTDSASAQGDPLTEYAEKCGYFTDSFSFQNYSRLLPATVSSPMYAQFLKLCSFPEASRSPGESYSGALATGRCVGLSILSVLAHNGRITPGDIQPGAKTIAEIEPNEETDAFLSHYQAVQGYSGFDMYMKWFVSHYTPRETVKILIDTAERAAAENRYFLIIHNSHVTTHAIAGMGIIDGSWSFRGKTYDKCVPVYDSNFPGSESDGFFTSASIYINSADLEAYIPFYETDTASDMCLFVTDDEGLMNYKGILSPAEAPETDLSRITRIELDGDDLTAASFRSDGTFYDPISAGRVSFRTDRGRAYYCDGDRFTISHSGTDKAYVCFTDTSAAYSINTDENMSEVTKDLSGVTISGKDTAYKMSAIFSEESCSFAPHCRYSVSGTADGSVSFSTSGSGIIISGTNGAKCRFQASDAVYSKDTGLPHFSGNSQQIDIYCSGSVCAAFDNDSKLKLFIDKDKNGTYSYPVDRGDVDCSGIIDAADATAVLMSYSAVSVGGEQFIDLSVGDMDSDGTLNAADATDILMIYADMSTK